MEDRYTHIVTDAIAAVQMANRNATTFAHPAYVAAEDQLRRLSDEDVALVVRMTGGLDPVDGRVQALVRGACVLEPTGAPTGAEDAPTGAEEAPTLEALCSTMRISASATDRQPPWQGQGYDGDVPWRGQGWNVTLARGELGVDWAEVAVPFWMGEAHGKTKPTALDVMECLCSDAASIENATRFEEWASELGYDADSRRAEAIYKSCGELADKLRAFLGNDFEAFIWAERD